MAARENSPLPVRWHRANAQSVARMLAYVRRHERSPAHFRRHAAELMDFTLAAAAHARLRADHRGAFELWWTRREPLQLRGADRDGEREHKPNLHPATRPPVSPEVVAHDDDYRADGLAADIIRELWAELHGVDLPGAVESMWTSGYPEELIETCRRHGRHDAWRALWAYREQIYLMAVAGVCGAPGDGTASVAEAPGGEPSDRPGTPPRPTPTST